MRVRVVRDLRAGPTVPGCLPESALSNISTPDHHLCKSVTPQGPLATWVEHETGVSMLAHLLLGFELQMLRPRSMRYAMIYWWVMLGGWMGAEACFSGVFIY